MLELITGTSPGRYGRGKWGHITIPSRAMQFWLYLLPFTPWVGILSGCCQSDGQLVRAIKEGDEATLERLIGEGHCVNRDPDGTPLHVALAERQTGCVEVLLKSGADPNRMGATDSSEPVDLPLEVAMYANDDLATPDFRPIELLLESGADPNKKNSEHPLGMTPEMRAAGAYRGIQTLEIFGEYGGDLFHEDSSGRTLLFMAASRGLSDNVRYLVEKGLDVNHMRDAGWTPFLSCLEYASTPRHLECLETLIELGAQPALRGEDGPTLVECYRERLESLEDDALRIKLTAIVAPYMEN